MTMVGCLTFEREAGEPTEGVANGPGPFPPPKMENARGERAFSGRQLGGSWGLLLSTQRLWGAGKELREFREFLC